MNARDSGLPVAIFHWTLTNTQSVPVRATIAFNLLNSVGYNGRDYLGNRHNAQFGQNLNTWRKEDDLEGLSMTGAKHGPDSAQFGTMALVTEWP